MDLHYHRPGGGQAVYEAVGYEGPVDGEAPDVAGRVEVFRVIWEVDTSVYELKETER